MAAERQQAGRGVGAGQRHQRHRADAGAVGAEQEFALRIADLAAARPRRGEQVLEAVEVAVAGADMAHEAQARPAASAAYAVEQQQHGVAGVEILAKRGSICGQHRAARGRADQPARELVDLRASCSLERAMVDQLRAAADSAGCSSRAAPSTWRSTRDTAARRASAAAAGVRAGRDCGGRTPGWPSATRRLLHRASAAGSSAIEVLLDACAPGSVHDNSTGR